MGSGWGFGWRVTRADPSGRIRYRVQRFTKKIIVQVEIRVWLTHKSKEDLTKCELFWRDAQPMDLMNYDVSKFHVIASES
jgi:hypothetical protein